MYILESSAQNLSIFSAHSFMDGLSDIGDKESYCSNSNTSEVSKTLLKIFVFYNYIRFFNNYYSANLKMD